MGCASSKGSVEVTHEVYKPPPASIAYFDLNTIGEPWLITTTTDGTADKHKVGEKPGHLPLTILEKVDRSDLAPQSWSEVSKALEDLKPSIQNAIPKQKSLPEPIEKKDQTPPEPTPAPTPVTAALRKNQMAVRTLEELDYQVTCEKKNGGLINPPLTPPNRARPVRNLPEGLKPVSQNSFILRDKQEREKNGLTAAEQMRKRLRRNPLEGLPEICPPAGEESVVLYTTTLHGVRRTFEDCETARLAVELLCPPGVDIDERDVSLHGEYLRELRALLGEYTAVPRLFIKGRCVGGVDEVVEMNETGRLRQMMRLVGPKGGGGENLKGRKGCEGCGGARFVPCLDCNGSRKVLDLDGNGVVRCEECNENGLVMCPLCN